MQCCPLDLNYPTDNSSTLGFGGEKGNFKLILTVMWKCLGQTDKEILTRKTWWGDLLYQTSRVIYRAATRLYAIVKYVSKTN